MSVNFFLDYFNQGDKASMALCVNDSKQKQLFWLKRTGAKEIERDGDVKFTSLKQFEQNSDRT